MQTVKYQIFVSSTYVDLIAEREQIIKAVLEMGHIPVGMEMFSAADEEQWKIIARQIDQSDYYVVIVAHRYGSLTGGISYTEKEYDYAVQQGVPVIGFVIDDKVAWPADRMENDNKKKKLLDKFKARVKSKPVGFWATADDMHGKFSIAFMKLFNTNPRPGWVRTTEIGGPEVLAELSRLSSENAALRAKVADLQKVPDTSHLAQGEDKMKFVVGDDKIGEIELTWNELFYLIAENSLKDVREETIQERIKEFIEDKSEARIQFSFLTNHPDTEKFFETIKTQLIALGLIEIRLLNEGGFIRNGWVLTPNGQKAFVDMQAIRREPK